MIIQKNQNCLSRIAAMHAGFTQLQPKIQTQIRQQKHKNTVKGTQGLTISNGNVTHTTGYRSFGIVQF